MLLLWNVRNVLPGEYLCALYSLCHGFQFWFLFKKDEVSVACTGSCNADNIFNEPLSLFKASWFEARYFESSFWQRLFRPFRKVMLLNLVVLAYHCLGWACVYINGFNYSLWWLFYWLFQHNRASKNNRRSPSHVLAVFDSEQAPCLNLLACCN